MKRVKVVRQNRCDEEMNFLVLVCFCFFAAMQVFPSGQSQLADRINMALYAVFVPGAVFRLGNCYHRFLRMNSEEYRRKWLLGTALRYGICFFALTLLNELSPNLMAVMRYDDNSLLLSALSNVLALFRIPSVTALFFAMAQASVLVWIFDRALGRLLGNWRRVIPVGIVFLMCAFLRCDGELYPIAAAFVGSGQQAAIPLMPYFAFFLLGAWFEKEKPGFRWQYALAAAAVTAVSLVLYRSPVQNLCRVTISFLPVYVIYLMSEGLSELTLRFRPLRSLCRTAEPACCVYVLLVLALGAFGLGSGLDAKWTLVLAAALILTVYAGFGGLWLFFRIYEAAAKRFERRTRFRTTVYFLIYTAVFALLLFLVFFAFVLDGKSLLWRADGVSQYYPRAVYFANYIREMLSNFLHGNFELPMYDFRFALGSEVVYSMEPLYFLFALFGAESAEPLYSVLILLRFYLAGITSSIFLLYFKKDYFTTFLGSVVYVFCGFSLFGGARHPMFMVQMILFPLLIIAIEEIVRGRRWYLCTILVALSLFSNYYLLYMSTFGMGVYFIVRYFCGPWKKSLKGFIGKGLVISGSYLLGVAMSCIILASNIGVYAGSGRSGGAIIKTPSLFFYSPEWLLRCFMSFPTTANAPGDWLRLGFLPITFFAVIFLFLRKGRKELKVLSVISAICMALPLTGFVLSGFSSITNRWCFMLALLAAYIVADCLPDMHRMSRRELSVCAAVTGIYGYFACFGTCLSTGFTKLAFLLLCVNLIVLLFVQEGKALLSRYGKQCLLVLLTLAMVFHSGFTLFKLNLVTGEYVKPGSAQALSENSPLRATEELEDDGFCRVGSRRLDYYTISSSCMYDYNSIYMFNSTMNGNIMEYMEKMGATTYSVTQFMGFNNRVFMNALAAVRYYADYLEECVRPLPFGYEETAHTQMNGHETVISENKYALPLGYTYTDAITKEELEKYDTAARQEILMQRVMLDDDELVEELQKESRRGETEPVSGLQQVEITSVKEKGIRLGKDRLDAKYEYQEGNESGEKKGKLKLKFSFEGLPDSETYLVLKNAFIRGDMSEEGIDFSFSVGDAKYSYNFRSDDDRYGTQQKDYIFNLGYHEEALDSLTIAMGREGIIQFDSLEFCCQPMDRLEQYTQALTEDVLEHVRTGTNCVSGDIDLEEDKVLVLSIPYQNGWTALVDGEPAKLERANYMYMALPLKAGAHTIELSFEIPGAKYALVIMPCAVVLFIILCLITWIVGRKKKRKHTGEEV